MRELPLIRRFRSRRRSKGQSLVEFALILPVFMLFFAATLDLGRIAAAQITVTNAAREGAFQARQTPTSFDNTQPCPADGKSNLVVCRTILESKDSVIKIAPSDIALSCNPSCGPALGNRVTVRVTGHFQLLTPLLSAFFGGTQSVTFHASSTHQIETFPAPPTPVVLTSAPPTATPVPSASASASPAPTSASCTVPSAGFSYSYSPSSKKAPMSMLVTDTSTSPNCGIDSWLWEWRKADGTFIGSSTNKSLSSISFSVAGDYAVTLRVGNSAGFNTTGAVTFTVKP